MRIYLSGIENASDLGKAVRWGADAIGIHTGNKSGLHPEKARELFLQMPLFISRVGIFADEKGYELQELISFCRVDTVHFTGAEQAGDMQNISEMLIKSVPAAELAQAAAYPVQAVSVPLPEAASALDLPVPGKMKLILHGRSAAEKIWQRTVERFQPYAIQLDLNYASCEMVHWLRQL